jgi:carboxyl-terminal processing protease
VIKLTCLFMKRLTFVALFCLVGFALTQSCEGLKQHPFMTRQERSHQFANVWTTVRDEYIYADYRGVDWQVVRKEFGKRILAVKTNEEFYSVVDQMILELGDDHSVYLSPWLTCEEDRYAESDDSAIDEPTVRRLEQNSKVLFIDLPSFNIYETGELLEAQLRRAIQKGPVSAVILDLRHNYGGYIDAAYAVLSHFVRGRLATEFDSEGKIPIRGEPGLFYKELSNIPLIVLIDSETHSAAELTAGILQTTRQAVVVGQTSAGNTEILLPFDFEDGSRLWLAIGGFTLADGTNLEGVGVIPKIVIDTYAKEDVYIDAGLEALGLQGQD